MSIRSRHTLVVGMLAAIFANGCGDCAGVGLPAVDLAIRDASSNAATARGAKVYLFKPPALTPIDSVIGFDSLHVFLGMDESGQLDVVVEKAGYWPWTAANVRVNKDCVTQTAFLEVRLRPRTP